MQYQESTGVDGSWFLNDRILVKGNGKLCGADTSLFMCNLEYEIFSIFIKKNLLGWTTHGQIENIIIIVKLEN